MSSLIFYTDPDQAVVVTDTLATNPEGSPYMFTSKALYLPHLKTIVAGTGFGGFSGAWVIEANNRMVVRGVENLNFHAPNTLREMWDDQRTRHSLDELWTTTVYHFGLSEESGKVMGFAYRSTNNFTSEPIPFGLYAKPECTSPPEGVNLFDHFQSMMNDQRATQAAKPAGARVFIGGEAVAIHLTSKECTFRSLFEFPDSKSDREQIFRTFT
jgi:hypothetical protein